MKGGARKPISVGILGQTVGVGSIGLALMHETESLGHHDETGSCGIRQFELDQFITGFGNDPDLLSIRKTVHVGVFQVRMSGKALRPQFHVIVFPRQTEPIGFVYPLRCQLDTVLLGQSRSQLAHLLQAPTQLVIDD